MFVVDVANVTNFFIKYNLLIICFSIIDNYTPFSSNATRLVISSEAISVRQ